MPQSKKRKHHHDFRPPTNAVKSKKNRSAIMISIIFFVVIGTGIAFFAAGSSPMWLFAGAILGGVGGYFFGRQIDKSFAKK